MNSSVDGRILWALWKCWVSLVILAAACSEGADSPTPDPAGDDATRDAGSLPSSISGDGDGMMDDGLAGMGGQGGSDAPAGTGGSGGNSPGDGPAECVLNEGERADACPMICRETCNGSDDDCDGRVDEGEAALECDVPNAEGACTRGACLIAECEGAYRDCDGEVENGCETSIESIEDCGLCGNRCDFPGALMACTDGRCEAIGCVDDLGDCDDNVGDCETAINTLSNCGQCGQPCGELPNAEQTCETGSCEVASCTEGFADCNAMAGDGCEQPLNTAEHCSSCGTACDLPGSTDDDCSSGDTCLAGACDEGWQECRGGRADGCEPLDTDTDCGECDRGCDATLERVVAAACDAGSCVIAECEDLFGDCDSDRFNGCETPTNTLERCGACDTPCAIPNAEVSCDSGTCTFVECEPGWLDCSGGLADGCETSANADTTCGACDNDCTVTTDPVCSGGSCSDVTCPDPDTADCAQDGLPCEVNLKTDVAHCGTCDFACAFNVGSPNASGLSCVDGGCVPQCEPGYGDCNGDHEDGCETPLNTLGNCGQCGQGCAISNATATCATGSCLVQQCDDDWGDCDGDASDCERRLNTVSDCGACDDACQLDGASETCGGTPGGRQCLIDACDESYLRDCDNDDATGCEEDLRSAVDHCGACGFDCRDQDQVSSASCVDSSCDFVCDGGYKDCNSQDADGCEQALNTSDNCGDCGVTCARSNGTASCATGACELTGCNTGFDECNGDEDDGCEPLTTLTDCGACNTPCLPPNASGSCDTGTCEVGTCASGWDDCDGDPSNGCERDTDTLGPCLPDAGCIPTTDGDGREYYFCPNARDWNDARSRCQLQFLGDLVQIDDADEELFVRGLIDQNVWIGATDQDSLSVEGSFVWSSDGSALAYTNWNAGEPNDVNGEDCAELQVGAGWNDLPCDWAHAYVCEVRPDLCPDSDKVDPGQCGCDTPDDDGDGDGTADCIDMCPMDPLKTAPGTCGCGEVDDDSDGDGVADCDDGCPNDPDKDPPGACGCGVPDVDTDGDGSFDCDDACPFDATSQAGPCAYAFTPSNFVPTTLDFADAPISTLGCSTTVTIDTDALTLSGWCGPEPEKVTIDQTDGPQAALLVLSALTVPVSTTVQVVGSRPLIIAASGDVVIEGRIEARGVGAASGPSGNSCGFLTGGAGGNDTNNGDGGGGGGGGGFGTVGGPGGWGHAGAAGALEGGVDGNPTLVPLRGGCPGGRGGYGGQGTDDRRWGGGGGGGLQISASRNLTIAGTAVLTVSGGGGRRGADDEDGGGGGGSGGGLLLESSALSLSSGSWVTANGGGGGSGNSSDSVNGVDGTDGFASGQANAAGGNAGSGSGDGGRGAALDGAATGGTNGVCTGFDLFGFCLLGSSGAGGGGGGGGAGIIHLRGVDSCTVSGNASPAASTACP